MTISFICSFAILSIVTFLFIPYFFLDSLINIKEKLKNLARNPLAILFVFFFLAQCIGLLWSDNIDYGMRRVAVMIPLLFLPAILLSEEISKRGFNTYLRISKYLILLVFFILLLVHLFIDGHIASTFVHFTVEEKLGISQFYIVFILLIPFLESLRQIHKRKQLLLNGLLFISSIGFMLILGNKTIMIFLFLFALVYIYKGFKTSRKILLFRLGIITLIVVGASQTSIVKNRVAVLYKTTDFNIEIIKTKNKYAETKNTLEHRILIDYLVLQEIGKSLLFGVGTGDYQDLLMDSYESISFKAGLKNKLNTHNQYLEEFLKTGILSGFTFIIIIAFLFRRSKKKQPFYIYYITIFAVACFLESYLVRQHGVIIFALFIPFFLTNDIE